MQYRKFAPLVKVNEATREIDVRVTSEVTDLAKEKLDWETTRPFIVEYSESVRKATEDLGVDVSLGNVRLMHSPVIAGKFSNVILDDAAKEWTGTIKVKEGEPWNDVLAGHVTGVSIGGDYIKRWDDPVETGVKRYTARINEVSLVDRPCNKDATFLAVRKDGESEMRKFAPRDEVSQLWDCKNDGCLAKHVKKDDARACLGAIAKAAMCACCTDGDCGCSSKADGACTCKAACSVCESNDCAGLEKAAVANQLKPGTLVPNGYHMPAPSAPAIDIHKSLWNVSGLASILAQLLSITRDEEYDETWDKIQAIQEGGSGEGSGIPVVEQLKVMCQSVFNALEAMLANERVELDAELNGEIALAAVARSLMKSPISRQLIKSLRVHDSNGSIPKPTAVEKEAPVSTNPTPVVTPVPDPKPVVTPETVVKTELPACNYPDDPTGHMHAAGVCKAEKMDATASAVIKALTPKFDTLATELTKRDEKIAGLEGAIDTLTKGVDFLLNQPSAPIGAYRPSVVVVKSADVPLPDGTTVVVQPTATPVLKYDSQGVGESITAMKSVIAGGIQNIDAPPRSAAA